MNKIKSNLNTLFSIPGISITSLNKLVSMVPERGSSFSVEGENVEHCPPQISCLLGNVKNFVVAAGFSLRK